MPADGCPLELLRLLLSHQIEIAERVLKRDAAKLAEKRRASRPLGGKCGSLCFGRVPDRLGTQTWPCSSGSFMLVALRSSEEASMDIRAASGDKCAPNARRDNPKQRDSAG